MKKSGEEEERLLAVIAQYRGLVLKLAWMYWRKLPAAVKVWVDPDDLIEEAYVSVIRDEAKRQWDAKRGRKSTFVWTSLNSMFLNFALAQQTQKRFGWRITLEDLACLGLGEDDKSIATLEAKQAFEKVWWASSSSLRGYEREWFGPEKPRMKWSEETRAAYREFRGLADKYRLSPNDCRQLMRGGMWLE